MRDHDGSTGGTASLSDPRASCHFWGRPDAA